MTELGFLNFESHSIIKSLELIHFCYLLIDFVYSMNISFFQEETYSSLHIIGNGLNVGCIGVIAQSYLSIYLCVCFLFFNKVLEGWVANRKFL